MPIKSVSNGSLGAACYSEMMIPSSQSSTVIFIFCSFLSVPKIEVERRLKEAEPEGQRGRFKDIIYDGGEKSSP